MSVGSCCIIISDGEDTMEDDTDRDDCIIMSIEDSTDDYMYNTSHKSKNRKAAKKKNIGKELLEIERRNHELRWRSNSIREVIEEKEKRFLLQRRLLRKYNKHLDMLTREVKRKDVDIAEVRQRNVRDRLKMDDERFTIMLETEKVRENKEEIAKEREKVEDLMKELEKEQKKNILLKWEMEEGKVNSVIQEQHLRIELEEQINILKKKLDETVCQECDDGENFELENIVSLLRLNIEEEENISKQFREQLIQKENSISNMNNIVSNMKFYIEQLKKTNIKKESLMSVLPYIEAEMKKLYGNNVENVENMENEENREVDTVENEEVNNMKN